MPHLTPIAMEPVTEVIEDLIALPRTIGIRSPFSRTHTPYHNRRERREDLARKETALADKERALAARSAELSDRELQLDAGRIHDIPIGQILPNPCQPRREFEDLALFSLTDSVRRHGILQPLTVRRLQTPALSTEASADSQPILPKTYSLICGERRLRAALAAGLQSVPCIVLDADDRRAAELALIENLQRENLNMFEQAGAIAALLDMNAMTQESLACALSVSQSCIANRLRILRLTEDERMLILSRHLSERHARAVLRIKDLELRKTALAQIAAHSLTVAAAEDYIDSLLTPPPAQTIPATETVPSSPSPSPNPNTSHEIRQAHSRKKAVLCDLRLFFNTVDRAARALREAGIQAEITRTDTPDTLTVSVHIPKPRSEG